METPIDMFSCAPDVSPEDVWGDATCLLADGPAVILPPKRAKQENHGGSTRAAEGAGGFRIGTHTSNHSAAETFPKLEVQEIHGDVVRLQPEEPEVAKMPRQIVFHERQDDLDELARAGEARDWGISKKQPILWILGTGIAVSAVVIGAIMALPFVNKPNEARAGSGEYEWAVETVADGDAMAGILSRRTEAELVFRDILTAPSAEAMMPLLRNSGEVAGLIRTSRRLPALAANSPPLKTVSWEAFENQALTYGILSVTLPDFSEIETYLTVTGGKLVMDWKASTAYGTAEFPQLMLNQGNPAEIRGWLEAGEYYTSGFSENGYQSYQLASPDKQQVIWAYARWGSETHHALKALMKGGYILEGRTEPQKVTVRLAPGPGYPMPGQWEVVELLHKEWIAP